MYGAIAVKQFQAILEDEVVLEEKYRVFFLYKVSKEQV